MLSFGGPRGARRRDAVPGERHPRPGHPARAARGRRRALPHFGGVSPINEQNRALIAAVEADLAAHGIDLPVYWGNRNWAPYVEDTWRQMADDGIEHVYVFATSAYASASGCRQYHEDVARARAALGPGAPTAEKLPHYSDAPGFVRANADALAAALAELPDDLRGSARLVATAHSIPDAMAAVAGPDGGAYEDELHAAARAVVDAVDPGRPVRPGLAEPQRPAVRAVAGARRQRPPAHAGRGGGDRGRRPPGRVRQRPPRGGLGPRQRGAARPPPSWG